MTRPRSPSNPQRWPIACARCAGHHEIAVKWPEGRICGAEAELRSKGRCWRCALADLVDELLTNPATGTVSDQLVPLAGALKAMGRPNSGVTWIEQAYVKTTLRTLAGRSSCQATRVGISSTRGRPGCAVRGCCRSERLGPRGRPGPREADQPLQVRYPAAVGRLSAGAVRRCYLGAAGDCVAVSFSWYR
jgi:hypothetical protein